jgi:hypothetical protein
VICVGGGGSEEWNRRLEAIAPCCEPGVASLLILRRFGPEERAVINRDYGVDR